MMGSLWGAKNRGKVSMLLWQIQAFTRVSQVETWSATSSQWSCPMMKWVRSGNSLNSVIDPGRWYLAKLLRFRDTGMMWSSEPAIINSGASGFLKSMRAVAVSDFAGMRRDSGATNFSYAC